MARAIRQFRNILAMILALGLFAGCNNSNNPGDAAGKDTKETANATAEEPANTAAAAPVEKIDDDLYPDFRLDQFTPEERVKVVKLTKAELCPCPDSNESMHECMQDRAKRCELAAQSMNMIGGMVKANYNDTDILDEVAKFLDAAKRQHSFNLENRPVKGSADASVMIVEFADFECPHCREASKVMDIVADKYGDKVGIIYKHYPLPAHQNAELAARAATAAHNQGKFWTMHDEIFKHQKSLSYDKIISIAQRTGMNMGKFKIDMESPDVREIVAVDRKDGENAGLTGTPTIFINGRRFLGDGTEESLFGAIDKALRDVAKTETTPTKTE